MMLLQRRRKGKNKYRRPNYIYKLLLEYDIKENGHVHANIE